MDCCGRHWFNLKSISCWFKRRRKKYLKINVSGGLIMVVLGGLLVPSYGALAAGILLLVIHGCMVGAQVYSVISLFHERVDEDK